MVGVPLRAAWRPLQLDSDLPCVEIELIPDIKVFLLLNLEVLVVVKSPLEGLLEVLNVDAGTLLVVFKRLDAGEELLNLCFLCITNTWPLDEVCLRIGKQGDEVRLGRSVEIRLQQVGVHIFEYCHWRVFWVLQVLQNLDEEVLKDICDLLEGLIKGGYGQENLFVVFCETSLTE